MEDSQAPAAPRAPAEIRRDLLDWANTTEPSLLVLQPLVTELRQVWAPPHTTAELGILLDGDWELLYSSKPTLASSGIDVLPGVVRTRTYQCIDAAAGRVWNLAELQTLFGLTGTVLVQARFTIESVTLVRVQFEGTTLLPGGIDTSGPRREAIGRIDRGERLGVRLPLQNTGTLDTLYIDGQVRIGLGNRGTIFVLGKI